MTNLSIILSTLAAFTAAGGQLLLRVGAHGQVTWSDFINLYIFSGLTLYALSTMVWIYVLSSEQLVQVYAFTALTFVLVYLGGVLLLDEHVGMKPVIGVLMILAGLYFITSADKLPA